MDHQPNTVLLHDGSGVDDQPCLQAVEALTRALELHDYRRGYFAETESHGMRVSRLALRLAQRVAPELAADQHLLAGFRLHDIGMIGVSESILRKPGPLTRADLDEIREHPILGERIIAPISCLGGIARQVIGAHHEHWNGTGYPRRLQGEQIPLPARIFSLADAFDAMTSSQPYRDALPLEIALTEIERGCGSQFDPELAPIFIQLVEEQTP